MGAKHSHVHEAKKSNYQVDAEAKTAGTRIRSEERVQMKRMEYEQQRQVEVRREQKIERDIMEGNGLAVILGKEVEDKAGKLVPLQGTDYKHGDKTVLIGYQDLENKAAIIEDVVTLFLTCPRQVQDQVGKVATQCVEVMSRHGKGKGRMTDLVNTEYNTVTFSMPVNGVETKFMFEWIVAFKYVQITEEKARYIGLIGTKTSELTRVGVSYRYQINNCGVAPDDGTVISISAQQKLEEDHGF